MSSLEDTVSLLIWARLSDKYVTCHKHDELCMPSTTIKNDQLTNEEAVKEAAFKQIEAMRLQDDFQHMKIMFHWCHVFPDGSGFHKFALSHTCVLVVCDRPTLFRGENNQYEWKTKNILNHIEILNRELVQAMEYFNSEKFDEYRSAFSPESLEETPVRALVSGPYNYEPVEVECRNAGEEFFQPTLPAKLYGSAIERIARETRVTKIDEHALHVRFLQASWPSFTLNFDKFEELFDWKSTAPGQHTPDERFVHVKRLFHAIDFIGQPENFPEAGRSSARRYKKYITFSDLLLAFNCCQSLSLGPEAKDCRVLATFAYYADEHSGLLNFDGLLQFLQHAQQANGRVTDKKVQEAATLLAMRIVPTWDFNTSTWSIDAPEFFKARRNSSAKLPDYRLLIGNYICDALLTEWLQFRVSRLVFSVCSLPTVEVLKQYQKTFSLSKSLRREVFHWLRILASRLVISHAVPPSDDNSMAADITDSADFVGIISTKEIKKISSFLSTAPAEWECSPEIVLCMRDAITSLGRVVCDLTVHLAKLRSQLQSLTPAAPRSSRKWIKSPHELSSNHGLPKSNVFSSGTPLTDQGVKDCPMSISASVRVDTNSQFGRTCDLDNESMQPISEMHQISIEQNHGGMSMPINNWSSVKEISCGPLLEASHSQKHLGDVVSLFICYKSDTETHFALSKYERGWYLPYRWLEERPNPNGELPTKFEAVKCTAENMVSELFPTAVRSSVKLHGIAHYWHKLLPKLDDSEIHRSLTHYCVLVTCENQLGFSASQASSANGQLQMQWASTNQIDEWFNSEILLGDEVKQLVVMWQDVQFESFRRSLQSEDLPFSGFSLASPMAYHDYQIISSDMHKFFERVLGEIPVSKQTEMALYMKFTEATWPSLSINKTTFKHFIPIEQVCPIQPSRPKQSAEARCTRLFQCLGFNRQKYLHYPLILFGFSVLQAQVPGVSAGGRALGERRSRYLFYFYDRNGDGYLDFDEFRELISDAALHGSLLPDYQRQWLVNEDLHGLANAIITGLKLTSQPPDTLRMDLIQFLQSRKKFLSSYRIHMLKSLNEISSLSDFPNFDCNNCFCLVEIFRVTEYTDKEKLVKFYNLLREVEFATNNYQCFDYVQCVRANRNCAVSRGFLQMNIAFLDGLIHYVLSIIKVLNHTMEFNS